MSIRAKNSLLAISSGYHKCQSGCEQHSHLGLTLDLLDLSTDGPSATRAIGEHEADSPSLRYPSCTVRCCLEYDVWRSGACLARGRGGVRESSMNA